MMGKHSQFESKMPYLHLNILGALQTICYNLPQNPVFELRRQCINQNKAESVTLRYSLYIYLTNPHGLYVTSLNVVLALSFLHYVMQAPPSSVYHIILTS